MPHLLNGDDSVYCICSGPCILRPHVQLGSYGLQLKVVLKWRDIYTENIRVVSLADGCKIEGTADWMVLNHRDHRTIT